MNDRSLTKNRAEALAAFVATLRADWQEPGIVAALKKAHDAGDAFEHGIWAIRAAADPSNRTPAVIALEGRHRKPVDPDEARTVTRDPTTHFDGMNCKHCGLMVVPTEKDHTCGRRSEPTDEYLLAKADLAAIAPPPAPNERPVEDVELPTEEETP